MKLLNLTPHAINLSNGKNISPSGDVARVHVTRLKDVEIDGVQFHVPSFGLPIGVPSYERGTVLVVSALVRTHPSLANRIDIVSPGSPIRDDAGAIIGCDGLDANGSMSWLAR